MGELRSLSEYAARRDALFAALVERLEADDRMVAAWLSGAHGRGEDDEWSDFDFHLAVRDEAFDGIRAEPLPLFELAGEVFLVQANFPSDSMPEGRFCLVVYPGPMHIDWNVGPVSAAARPLASRLIFEKQPIPFAPDRAPLSLEEVRETAQNALEFFWAMVPIAVKYAGRGWTRRAVQQEALLAGAFQRLWRLSHGQPLRSQDVYDQNRPPEPAMLAAQPVLGPVIDAADALRATWEYCEAVAALHGALAALGVDIPGHMPAEVRLLVTIAEGEIAKDEIRRGTGSQR